jgi:hypothetical protein
LIPVLKEMKDTFLEIFQAILPVILIIALLQATLIRMPAEAFTRFLIGGAMVTVGLFLFLTGVRIGLLPVGEAIGSSLVARGSVVILLGASFVLSFAVTVAEPDVRVLAYQVDLASQGRIGAGVLITAVALGVAVFVALALLRILLGVPMAYLLAAGYGVVLILTLFTPPHFVAISLDAGGVTTGPMAVPFILALGLGTTSVLGGKSALSDGFGLVGLASIGPIIGVMLLGVILGG